jgi:glycosyltransferase involved in cell wall biosynthesis
VPSERVSNAPRMLIVWDWIPCNNSGAGILMRRLFDKYPSDRLWALTSARNKRALASFDPVPPPERQTSVPEIQIHRRWIHRLTPLLNYMLIPWTVWRGVRLVRRAKIEALFAVPWNSFCIAAYFIHKITNRPIYMYIMDDPAGRRLFGGLQPVVYALLMGRVVRACKRVWGVSEGMCEYFEQTYGVKCQPLLPLVDIESFRKEAAKRQVRTDDTFHIIYTGSIYVAQLDAVRRLVHVVDQECDRDRSAQVKMQLTLYTSLPAEALEKMGLAGRNVRRDEVRPEEIATVFEGADVAFLPLSFEPDMRHIVETSFPSKTAEYLAAGVPVLVHAPSRSAVARYCAERGCGLVVGEPNEDALREALVRLSRDAALRNELSAKALDTAGKYHDANAISQVFIEQMC